MNLTPLPDCSTQVLNTGLAAESGSMCNVCGYLLVCTLLCAVFSLWWCSQQPAAAARPHSLCHEENSCFTSMSGCEPRPRGSPHLLWSSPPFVQSHRYSASYTNPFRLLYF